MNELINNLSNEHIFINSLKKRKRNVEIVDNRLYGKTHLRILVEFNLQFSQFGFINSVCNLHVSSSMSCTLKF